jgi:hypothetical protein
MDRETSLRLAPIFRGISIICIIITFLTWLFPYFEYDADVNFGIDPSKGPLKFVAVDGAYWDETTNSYVGEYKAVSQFYRGNDTLKALNGRDEVRDYPTRYSLWQYILFPYNYPQILVKMDFEGSKAKDAPYHNLFWSDNADGTSVMRRYRDIKDTGKNSLADIDHKDVDKVPRFIRMWNLCPTLLQILFGLVGLLLCWKKRGVMTQLFPFAFGICGIIGSVGNRIISWYSPQYFYSYVLQLAASILVLLVAIVGMIVQIFELKSRPEEYYLPMN